VVQKLFDGTDTHFRWTKSGWYEFDHTAARKAALKARNQHARQLSEQGYVVTKFSLGRQLVSRGGIGSDRPHIELEVSCYGLNAYKEPSAQNWGEKKSV